MSGAGVGGVIGLLIGIMLSAYVTLVDYRKRQAGVRTRAQYRLSLIAVPIILALLGSLVGGAIAQL